MLEYAKSISWVPEWEAGAPDPQVFSNGQRTYLIYTIDSDDTSGGYVKMDNSENSRENVCPLALVEFNASTFRFGIAGDEVFSGLPLYEQGLDGRAHEIINSSWIEELKNTHKVHPYYKEDNWRGMKHYVLLFKDNIFEIIARGVYSVKKYKTTYKELAIEVAELMNDRNIF